MAQKHIFGFLLNYTALWIGIHYSEEAKRLCVNIVPFVTFFVVFPGGQIPRYKGRPQWTTK